MDFNALNDNQKEAVLTLDGRLLIFAGAGSGKTRTLIFRAENMLKHGVQPENILCITFTRKAAGEIRSRLLGMSAPGAERIVTGTFHAICASILRESGGSIGIPGYFTIPDSQETRKVLEDAAKRNGAPTDAAMLNSAESLISLVKTKAIWQDDDILKEISSYPYMLYQSGMDAAMAFRVYKTYQSTLQRCAEMDYDDILVNTVRLFESDPAALAKYQDRYQYIQVDEYQDVNEAQFQIIRYLSAKYGNLCVVGDDDQAIYEFRGANPSFILNFAKEYPNAKIIILGQNYRSTQTIVNAASSVVAHNTARVEKAISSVGEEGSKIRCYEFENPEQEAYWIVNEVRQQQASIPLKDNAILVRTWNQVKAVKEACDALNVPYLEFDNSESYLDTDAVRTVLSFLRVYVNMNDDAAMEQVMKTMLPAKVYGVIRKIAGRHQETLFKIADVIAPTKHSNAEYRQEALMMMSDDASWEALAQYRAAIRDMFLRQQQRKAENRTNLVLLLIDDILDFMDVRDKVTANRSPEDVMTILTNIDMLRERAYGQNNCTEFLSSITLDREEGDSAEINAVNIMTLHKSKGLEFERVYIVGLQDKVMPSKKNSVGALLESERRLFYVGMTRAKTQLVLSYGGGERSRFIEEVPERYVTWRRMLKQITAEEIPEYGEIVRKRVQKRLNEQQMYSPHNAMGQALQNLQF